MLHFANYYQYKIIRELVEFESKLTLLAATHPMMEAKACGGGRTHAVAFATNLQILGIS